jgi:hypothetical protein
MVKALIRSLTLALAFAALPLSAPAEEGMWLFNEFPVEQVKQRYKFDPTEEWLDRLRLASVRFNNGGSGSFVSPQGLAMTNHHVGRECIQALSTAENNYIANGFYARTHAEEKPCPDFELNVLVSLDDVTEQVNATLTPEMSDAGRARAQREQTARIEKECADRTGLRCDVVTLYAGELFNVYRYKKFTDVRLVFAPEEDIAFFGGDPDNFTFPRYCLDVAFFRAYENGQPARTEQFLRWSPNGAREGDLVFVSGHPGSTGRLLTLSQLEFLRDVRYPTILRALERWRKALAEFSARGEEEARVASDDLFSVENSLKAIKGYQSGLLDPQLMAAKRKDEEDLRARVAANPEWQRQYGGAWDALARAQQSFRAFFAPWYFVEFSGVGLKASKLFTHARHLVRLAEEKTKANEQRLPPYRESALPSLELQLYSTAPLYDSLEIANFTHGLAVLQEELGGANPLARKLLAGKTPAQRAEELVRGTKLQDVAERKRLAAGGLEAIQNSQDPMIVFAREVDADARALLKRYEDEIESVEQTQGTLVAKALFAARGRSVAPEATFTLRLSYGAVRGYVENKEKIPWATDFRGLYKRATGRSPYRLPKSFVERKSALKLKTPFNFVSTNDIIGGNSGSPVVNASGEVVGLIFDGNIHQLPNRFLYREELPRAISVHSEGIREALRSVYQAKELLEELSDTP